MIAYDNAIRALEAKCQKLEENARIMERNHKEETTSLRQAVQELNAENEELANDVQEMLGESDELQQTLEQLARANRIMKDKNQLLRQERDSLLEQLETTKHLLKQREEDPQEVHHWKYTMKRQLNLITEEKNALENALNRANNEKDNIFDECTKLQTEVNQLKDDLRKKKAVIEILQNAHQTISSSKSNNNLNVKSSNLNLSGLENAPGNSIVKMRRPSLIESMAKRNSLNPNLCAERKNSFLGSLVNAIMPNRNSSSSSSSLHQPQLENNPFPDRANAEFILPSSENVVARSNALVGDKNINELHLKSLQGMLGNGSHPTPPPAVVPLFTLPSNTSNLLLDQTNKADERASRINPFKTQIRENNDTATRINPFLPQINGTNDTATTINPFSPNISEANDKVAKINPFNPRNSESINTVTRINPFRPNINDTISGSMNTKKPDFPRIESKDSISSNSSIDDDQSALIVGFGRRQSS